MAVYDFLLPKRMRKDGPIVPVVRLEGVISSGGGGVRSGLSLQSAAGPLQKAFSIKPAPAVAVVINSPGGSPVQSMLIHKRIRQLADEKDKSVIVFVEDVAASGGYMIACAGDRIVADPSSVVGSIGVISASFGFEKAIEKLGIERRVHTAGTRKMMLDPFSPEKPDDVRRLRALQRSIHETFIDLVKSRRDSALTGEDKTLFTGEFWEGRSALGLGLIDELGDLRSYMRNRYGKDVKLKPVTGRRRLGGLRIPRMALSGDAGMSPERSLPGLLAADDWIGAIEERALWGRYGL
ncbi:MAG: S49 family peptidase [Pseudomonadota bacterium]